MKHSWAMREPRGSHDWVCGSHVSATCSHVGATHVRHVTSAWSHFRHTWILGDECLSQVWAIPASCVSPASEKCQPHLNHLSPTSEPHVRHVWAMCQLRHTKCQPHSNHVVGEMNGWVSLVICLVDAMKGEEERQPRCWEKPEKQREENKEKQVPHTLTSSASSLS